MFSALGDNLSKIFDKIRSTGYITEKDLDSTMREIRIALLEADVSLEVAKEFISQVKLEAEGQKLIKSISPSDLIVKIVHDKLTEILGSESYEINLCTTPPAIIMLVGLQGSGKTTTAAKLALHLKKLKKEVMLVSTDVYRPAARDQLSVLADKIDVDISQRNIEKKSPIEITKDALKDAASYDVLIIDTAGRLHTDDDLMNEMHQIKEIANPSEVMLVVDSMMGQDAINVAKSFGEIITGITLTRSDGDARGGAALSMKMSTGKPIKFMGVGENTTDFEIFHPERVSSVILRMGDVVSLVEKVSEVVKEEEAQDLMLKMQSGSFDMNDLLSQLKKFKKIGGVGKMLGMIPGASKLKLKMPQGEDGDKMIKRQEAIIYSMTKLERARPFIINASRRKRIATGSGAKIQDVNKLIKQFSSMGKMMKKVSKMDMSNLPKNIAGIDTSKLLGNLK